MIQSPTVPGASPRPAPARPAMRAAQQQTGAGRIGAVGPVLAILLTAAGVVLLHDALTRANLMPGRPWLPAVVRGLDRSIAEWWLIPAGIAVALIGVWLIVTALRPRSRDTLAVNSTTGVFLRTRDIARLASAAADDVDGVLSATSVASRRAVTVTIESTTTEIAAPVRDAVGQRLAALSTPLTVKVRIRPHRQHGEGN